MSSSILETKLSTVYFPLTGDPTGHNHLLLAESVLQQFPETQLIIFIISNGIHPDPLKYREIPPAAIRSEILRKALNDWAHPENSIAAQIAAESGFKFKLADNNCAVSLRELSYNRSIRLAEHIRIFSTAEKIRMILGADLLERMLNPAIFTNEDLAEICSKCHLLLAPRNNIEIEFLLSKLKKKRGITLSVSLIKTESFPKSLQKLFLISSTLIRRASQAGHDLNPFLPATSVQQIKLYGCYEKGKNNLKIQASTLTELQQRLHRLMEQLEKAAKKLQKLLIDYETQKKTYRFSILETSTGGQIAEAFTSLPGASVHFLEGRILYSLEAQSQFLGNINTAKSNVSQKKAIDLAEAMLKDSRADWAIAETGMAGPPTSKSRSSKNGQCHLGLALSDEVRYKFLEFNPFLTRKEHQLLFAIEALNWAEEVLYNSRITNK